MTDAPAAPPPTKSNPVVRTAVFVVVVGLVLGTFVVLGKQDKPPLMPATAPHKLRFNLAGDLIGVMGEPGLGDGMEGVVVEKKAVERRVNTTCQACHGAPAMDLTGHACATVGKCIPEQHPPKMECIKCHRMPSTLPTSTSTP